MYLPATPVCPLLFTLIQEPLGAQWRHNVGIIIFSSLRIENCGPAVSAANYLVSGECPGLVFVFSLQTLSLLQSWPTPAKPGTLEVRAGVNIPE